MPARFYGSKSGSSNGGSSRQEGVFYSRTGQYKGPSPSGGVYQSSLAGSVPVAGGVQKTPTSPITQTYEPASAPAFASPTAVTTLGISTPTQLSPIGYYTVGGKTLSISQYYNPLYQPYGERFSEKYALTPYSQKFQETYFQQKPREEEPTSIFTPGIMTYGGEIKSVQQEFIPSVFEYKPEKLPFGLRTSGKLSQKAEKLSFEASRLRAQGSSGFSKEAQSFIFSAGAGTLGALGSLLHPIQTTKGIINFLKQPRENLLEFGYKLKTRPVITVGELFGQFAAGEIIGGITKPVFKPVTEKVQATYTEFNLARQLQPEEKAFFKDVLIVAKGIKGEKAPIEKPISFKIPERVRPVAGIVEQVIREKAPESVVFGSSVVPSQITMPIKQFLGRSLHDIDLLTLDPVKTGQEFYSRLQTKGYRLESSGSILTPEGQHLIDIKPFQSTTAQILDVSPEELGQEASIFGGAFTSPRTIEPGGIKQFTLEQQTMRKLAAISAVKEGKISIPEHRAFKDLNDALRQSGLLIETAKTKKGYFIETTEGKRFDLFRTARLSKAEKALERLRSSELARNILRQGRPSENIPELRFRQLKTKDTSYIPSLSLYPKTSVSGVPYYLQTKASELPSYRRYYSPKSVSSEYYPYAYSSKSMRSYLPSPSVRPSSRVPSPISSLRSPSPSPRSPSPRIPSPSLRPPSPTTPSPSPVPSKTPPSKVPYYYLPKIYKSPLPPVIPPPYFPSKGGGDFGGAIFEPRRGKKDIYTASLVALGLNIRAKSVRQKLLTPFSTRPILPKMKLMRKIKIR